MEYIMSLLYLHVIFNIFYKTKFPLYPWKEAETLDTLYFRRDGLPTSPPRQQDRVDPDLVQTWPRQRQLERHGLEQLAGQAGEGPGGDQVFLRNLSIFNFLSIVPPPRQPYHNETYQSNELYAGRTDGRMFVECGEMGAEKPGKDCSHLCWVTLVPRSGLPDVQDQQRGTVLCALHQGELLRLWWRQALHNGEMVGGVDRTHTSHRSNWTRYSAGCPVPTQRRARYQTRPKIDRKLVFQMPENIPTAIREQFKKNIADGKPALNNKWVSPFLTWPLAEGVAGVPGGEPRGQGEPRGYQLHP